MTKLNWPMILTTNGDTGVPAYPFVATEDGTAVIGYNHQAPSAFADELTRYFQTLLGEDFDPDFNTVTPDQVQHLWATDSPDGWLEECDAKAPDAFPITLYGSL